MQRKELAGAPYSAPQGFPRNPKTPQGIHMCVYLCTRIYANRHLHKCIHVYVYVYVCMYARRYGYVCTHEIFRGAKGPGESGFQVPWDPSLSVLDIPWTWSGLSRVLEMCSRSPWDVLGCHLGALGQQRGWLSEPLETPKLLLSIIWLSFWHFSKLPRGTISKSMGRGAMHTRFLSIKRLPF